MFVGYRNLFGYRNIGKGEFFSIYEARDRWKELFYHSYRFTSTVDYKSSIQFFELFFQTSVRFLPFGEFVNSKLFHTRVKLLIFSCILYV